MDNFQGDLTDIVRASAGAGGTSGEPEWQFPADQPMNNMDMFQQQQPIMNPPLHGFGNPFSNMRDPLLHHLQPPNSTASSSSAFFIPTTKQILPPPAAAGALLQDSPTRFLGILGPKIFDDDHKKPPCTNRFSQMLQISTAGGGGGAAASPCGSPVVGGGASPKTGDMINANSSNSSGQISSPRNPGIKRRKSQAKKVVCIPAPASANSRPTGEVVPSDLWAWRKYGQKPIKGSPYPRGYYRCSSSKGCSARKQVERSRTDPNMLVITYTSEHNHPWPTQRNALAGSTRSQPSKNNAKPFKMGTTKEEEHKDQAENNTGSSSTVAPVKEEMQDMEKQLEDKRFSDGFSYRPAMPDSTMLSEQDSFFADLDEIEADPLHLLFTQGFSGEDDDQGGERKDQSKAGVDDDDQFSLFDWSSEDNNKGL